MNKHTPHHLQALHRRYGSYSHLARHLGMDPRTFRQMRAKMNGPTERLIIQAGQRLRLQLALKELIRQGLVPLPEFRRVWLEVARPGANPNTGASPRNSRGKTQ